MPGEDALDAIARGLARGMSRRQALRTGGALLLGTTFLTPAQAWAKVKGKPKSKRCPRHHVSCNHQCCPPGEICFHPKAKKHGKHAPKPKPYCACPPRSKRCKGKCVNTGKDASNCGRCGNTCPPGQFCSGGKCGCPAGRTQCGNTCVNPSSDPNNCGACGHVCAEGTTCASGACVGGGCPAGTTNCSGACVNVTSDPGNCGACGQVCTAGTVCAGGTCVISCPSGTVECAGACVTLASDPNNCGGCGIACGAGMVCSGGTCKGCAGGDQVCGGNCCPGTGCCGSECQTAHNNGVGDTYYDCLAQGTPGDASTYSVQLATDARAAYSLSTSSDVATSCNGGDTEVLVRYNEQTYVTWAYTGDAAGRVTVNNLGNGPLCPDTSSPTWN